ncbi:Fungal specific transcription factor domain-containing protein [Cladophialophora immunda]|nr:Fungal specific transcription factor domain-containing protein [Cladophialophora immunda]
MMAVCPFAPASLLQKLGHNNAQDAQQLCYERVRHLLHCDVESDPIARLQALLLMTQSTEVRDGARDCCFWSGTALAYAESLDLLKMARATKDAKDKGFLHSLWCCCFVSETIFAFSRRRAPKMRMDLECEQALRSPEFNDQRLPVASVESSPCNPAGATAHPMEPFGNLVRLMSHINYMLSIKHAAPYPSSHHDTIALGSETGSFMALTSPELENCRSQLQKNAKILSEKLRQSPDERSPSDAGPRAASESLFLRMLMAAADCVFYFDPRCTLRCRHTANERVNCRKLRKRACDAAHQSSQLAKDALGSQCPYFMPAWSLHFLLPPVTILILEAKSSNGEAHDLAIQRLVSLTGLLQMLGKRFTAVQRAVTLLEAAIKSAGGPLQTLGIPPRDGTSHHISGEARNINSFANGFSVFPTHLESLSPVTEDGKNSRQGRAIGGEQFSPNHFEWIRAANVSTSPAVAGSPVRKAAGQDIEGLSSSYLFELEDRYVEQLNVASDTVFGSWSSPSSADPYTQQCLQPTLKEFTAADDITSPWLGGWEDLLQSQT